jgi:hypothetical protein
VWGDQAYRGQRAVIREHAPKARDFTNRRYRQRGVVDEVERAKNRTKSKVRARVEHSIGVIKRCSASPRFAIAGSKRTPIACSSPAHWPICSWRAGIYCGAKRRNVSKPGRQPCTPPIRHQPTRNFHVPLASEEIVMLPILAPAPCSDGVSRWFRRWSPEAKLAVLHTDVGHEVRMSRPQTSIEEGLTMKHCAGLDLSVKETAICIVDETGKIVREAKVTMEPEAVVALLNDAGLGYARVGLEAGPMSQWMVTGLLEAGLPVVCVETRHMKAVLKAQQVNKSDRNDMRAGWRR